MRVIYCNVCGREARQGEICDLHWIKGDVERGVVVRDVCKNCKKWLTQRIQELATPQIKKE